MTCFRPILPRIRPSVAAALVLAVAGTAHAQQFEFASQAQARDILGRQDAYVLSTAARERSVLLKTEATVTPELFARAMAETALEWSEEERRGFAEVLPRLQRFLAPMRWKAPSTILLVKVSDRLMDGFPHTRANAIVLPEGMLRDALARPVLMDYLMAHELFHVLTRADSALREELYSAIGFRACERTELPAALAEQRITNPDAPEKRYAIRLTRGEVMPFVHFAAEPIDVAKGFSVHARTSWLPVDRHDGNCRALDERLTTDSLEGLYEQVGRNTGYLIHPEEILADNFALLFRAPAKIASPEVSARIERILRR
jgi:hypothetical protein